MRLTMTDLPRACPALVAVLALSGCGAPAPATRAYDLDLSHPSPHSTYLQVTPGASGAALPPPSQILTGSFNRHLRRTTGCTMDASTPAAIMGNRTVPAGYLVPVVCP